MKTRRSCTASALAFVATLTAASPASANILIAFAEVGSDMVASVSGSFTLPTAPTPTSVTLSTVVAPGLPVIGVGEGSFQAFSYEFESLFPPLGPGGPAFGTAAAITDEERFFMLAGGMGINTDYVSGSALEGTLTWSGQSFSTLGLTPGSYSRAFAEDATQSLTVNVGPAAPVPAPATLSLALGGLLWGGYPLWRRRGGGE